MKEIILRSKKYSNLVLQIFNECEFGMLGENLNKDERPGEEMFVDNVIYAYEIYKLLQEADKRKCFDDLKENEEDERNVEEILI